MTPDMEQTVLQALYDRLFDAITYVPGGSSAPFDKATTFLQFSKNEAINPDDFKDPASPTNPNGGLGTAEAFANMVDSVPAVQAAFTPGPTPLSQVYKNIVTNANTELTVNPDQKKIYQQAYDYLNTATTVKDFMGNETTQYGPSQIYGTYLQNQTAYINAVAAYRTAYNNYDLTDPKQQRQWQANEPLLQNAVTQAYNTWRSQGATQVEQALNALASSINNAVSSAISDAQKAVSDQYQLASQLTAGSHWFMTLALPSNWADPAATANFTQLTLRSQNLNTSSDSSFTSYGGGGSWSNGLWSVGGNFAGSKGSQSSHMDANNLTLSAKIGVVRVLRPWLHEFLFRMNGWSMIGVDINGISNGALKGNEDGTLPLLPTAFVVARDIAISADFSSQDQKTVESSISAGLRVGWGPFSIAGNYAHGESHDTFQSTFDGGTLKVPGIQILAWVSEIVPACPPMAARTGAATVAV